MCGETQQDGHLSAFACGSQPPPHVQAWLRYRESDMKRMYHRLGEAERRNHTVGECTRGCDSKRSSKSDNAGSEKVRERKATKERER